MERGESSSGPSVDRDRLPLVRLRSLLLLAAGVAIGMRLAAKFREDDPNVVHGPQRSRGDRRPALRLVSGQVQRLTEAATGRSLEAIQRVRSEIRHRLGEDDAAAWN
jgi:hypothetical protein